MNFDKKTFVTIVGLGVFAMAAGSVLAEGSSQRMHNQHQRIEQGVNSGQLNRHEAARLNHEQRQIRNEAREYRSDGVVTKAERADLRHDQNRASRHIYAEKHDGQSGTAGAVRDPGVNARQVNQRERIQQGVRSGELTRGEARQLGTEQRSVRQEERQYKSDGVLTKTERKDLQQDLNVVSKDIYNEKHDAERR
ncbi:hypothetical protein SCD_n01834 [Sulfuricella denitrificans skB26]|uniref:Uncharacterized protein n=1 Tax=Sulfuricella denitrificans (strain DSM 22764 / NBRC 105220 / skB26) TaxID=1163617 RepID=S6AAD0_SULDS|nr:hypothetical protein [Sulfuricella denitrificans]BAN35645.1 hypothetical protein SCD_n01834 [Sulfuricella denitrificans skB26]